MPRYQLTLNQWSKRHGHKVAKHPDRRVTIADVSPSYAIELFDLLDYSVTHRQRHNYTLRPKP